MESILNKALIAVQHSDIAFSKFITANDVGATGGHQSGFHIHKNAWSLIFTSPGERGSNKDKFVTIKWQDDFETSSRFIYYGTNTRNEYRLTRFGRHFPYLQDENIGDLLILVKENDTFYKAYVLQNDEEIEDFFVALNISPTDTNGIIQRQFQQNTEIELIACFNSFINSLGFDFPSTLELAFNARDCYNKAYQVTSHLIKLNPDKKLLAWLDSEFQLFKSIEDKMYSTRIQRQFSNVEELVEFANTILNRRKSRAGKSLEHHLSEIFKTFDVSFVSQAITEDNKKPDFLFPNDESYRNSRFDEHKLIMLASKTTCKDRWRQVLNEADRIKIKHLFTLQQGISKNQLDEMYKYNVHLVVPKPYLLSFPKEYQDKIYTLDSFVQFVKYRQQ